MTKCDVAILGAGPYGLAASAHLRSISGLDVKTFGEPMEFWKSQMPEGMFLRSPWSASHISDPASQLSFASYRDKFSRTIPKPIPLDEFVNYGLWFQSQAIPDLDKRKVSRIDFANPGFRLTLNDGDSVDAKRVVVAGGIKSFATRPQVFANLTPQHVMHSSDGRDVKQFAGKRVIVVGAGQSALESAALIHEAGANVEVIVRRPAIHWLGWRARVQKLGPISKMLYAPTDVGTAGVSQIVARPDLVKYFPRFLQTRFRTRALRPAGSRWLQPRFDNIKVSTGRTVTEASLKGNEVFLKLDDGSTRQADFIVTGTGYKVDVAKYPFLSPQLVEKIDRVQGFPLLKPGLESSVPGLHFLGAPAAWIFGPLMYFVAGTEYAGSRVAGAIASAHERKAL